MAKTLIKQFAQIAPTEIVNGRIVYEYIALESDSPKLPEDLKNARDIPDDPHNFSLYSAQYKRILLGFQKYGIWLGYEPKECPGKASVNLIGVHFWELWPKVAQLVYMGEIEGERVRSGAERVGHQTPGSLADWTEWKRCWTEDLKREGEPHFFYPCTNGQDPSPMHDYLLLQRHEEDVRKNNEVRNSPEYKADLERIETRKKERARLVQARKDEGLEAALEQWAKTVAEGLPPHVARFAANSDPTYWAKHWHEQDKRDGMTNGTRSTILSGEDSQYQLDREAFGDDFTRGLQLLVLEVVKPVLEAELVRRNPLPLPPDKDKGEPDAVR
jgi:hypothetical protein